MMAHISEGRGLFKDSVYTPDEIDVLRAENERLRALLAEVIDLAENFLVVTCDASASEVVDRIREALK